MGPVSGLVQTLEGASACGIKPTGELAVELAGAHVVIMER